MHNFVHIQLQVTDLDKTITFYSNVFKWNVYRSPDMEDYLIYEIDDEHTGGGFSLAKEGVSPSTGTMVIYIHAKNIDATLELIKKFDGKVILEKTFFPHGAVARFEDPFGNILGLWSED